jgi:hypothetical protein
VHVQKQRQRQGFRRGGRQFCVQSTAQGFRQSRRKQDVHSRQGIADKHSGEIFLRAEQAGSEEETYDAIQGRD